MILDKKDIQKLILMCANEENQDFELIAKLTRLENNNSDRYIIQFYDDTGFHSDEPIRDWFSSNLRHRIDPEKTIWISVNLE